MDQVPDSKAVYDSIFGIVFLGTPHQGSPVADIASTAIDILKITTITGRTDIFVKALKGGSPELLELIDQFRNLNHLKVISIYETERTNRVRAQLPLKQRNL